MAEAFQQRAQALMRYEMLTWLHLATILPAFVIATWLMARRKGSARHRSLGRVFMVLMIATAAITLLMPATLGPTWLGHFGYIHLFSAFVLIAAPRAWLAARRHDVIAHRYGMLGLYIGALLIAGAFTLTPGRLLHRWLFG